MPLMMQFTLLSAVLLEMGLSYQTIKDIVAASTQKSALPSAANT
jgi:hypothetical protein